MTRRVGAIDLGSNTVRLLVADVDDLGVWREVVRERRITRLGEGLYATGKVASAAVERTVKALREFREIADRLEARDLAVAGTSAVRESDNRDELLAAIQEATGFRVEVIGGEEEAARMWLGVCSEIPRTSDATTVVVDVGGGSTEWIAGREEILSLISLPIGVVRLAEEFPVSGPLAAAERERLLGRALEAASLAASVVRVDPPVRVVGTAGTPTTLAALDLALEVYDRSRVSGYFVPANRMDAWFDRLCRLPAAERLKIPGLEPGREDLIIPGLALLKATVSVFGADGMVVSDGGLLEGILIHRFVNGGAVRPATVGPGAAG